MKRRPATNFQNLNPMTKGTSTGFVIYRFSNAFPKKELYRLTSETKRGGAEFWLLTPGFQKSFPFSLSQSCAM
jgi:hypothetical protein